MHKFDVVIIGGGPAGMMAAGRAAENGRSVLLLEKNSSLGKKLLITGGGRCNVTNNKTNIREMLEKYTGNDQFLFSAFTQFSVKDTLEFFHSRGMHTKEENDGRMFPVSNSAKSVFDVLVKYMKQGKVTVKTNVQVTGLSLDTQKNIVIENNTGEHITTKYCVMATGGKSRPETGSTGEGFAWLKNLGHNIINNDFALVPISLSDIWIKEIAGTVLKDIKITLLQDAKKQLVKRGDILFTHFGISGPTMLNMSRNIGDLLSYGDVTIELDIFPSKDLGSLRKELQELLASEPNKKLKNVLGKLIPSSFIDTALKIVSINGETTNNMVSAEDRKKLTTFLKCIPLHVTGLVGEKAVISSGGVDLTEVNFKTMQSRIIPNLYLIGDVLNIDRPSGGYSLQLCWTCGFVAGDHVGKE